MRMQLRVCLCVCLCLCVGVFVCVCVRFNSTAETTKLNFKSKSLQESKIPFAENHLHNSGGFSSWSSTLNFTSAIIFHQKCLRLRVAHSKIPSVQLTRTHNSNFNIHTKRSKTAFFSFLFVHQLVGCSALLHRFRVRRFVFSFGKRQSPCSLPLLAPYICAVFSSSRHYHRIVTSGHLNVCWKYANAVRKASIHAVGRIDLDELILDSKRRWFWSMSI